MAAKQATPGSSEDCAVMGFCMELWNELKLVFCENAASESANVLIQS